MELAPIGWDQCYIGRLPKTEKKKRKEKKKKEEGLMELAQSVGTNAWFIFWSMLPNLKNVDNCEVIIYLFGSYK